MAKLYFGWRKKRARVTGPALVADFTAALTNLATAETAKYAASQTEQQTIQTINQAAPQNSVYVTPQDMSPAMQATVARSSVDAHLKKVQAEQITAYTEQQLVQMEQAARDNYIGRKVKIKVLDRQFKPLEALWFSSKTGHSSQTAVKYKQIKGVVDDLSLRKNAVVLRPTITSKLFIPDRKFIIVYVINPANLQPAVEIELL